MTNKITHWRHKKKINSYFPDTLLSLITKKVQESEKKHRGEIRFVIEAKLPSGYSKEDSRTRAIDIFSQQKVWDTEENNGVLIYVLCDPKRIEILTDRGLRGVTPDTWLRISAQMENDFRAGRFEPGAISAINHITAILSKYFPFVAGNVNELPDNPVLL